MIVLIFFSSCEKSDSTGEKYSLEINFKHFVDDSEIIYSLEDMIYQNAMGVPSSSSYTVSPNSRRSLSPYPVPIIMRPLVK